MFTCRCRGRDHREIESIGWGSALKRRRWRIHPEHHQIFMIVVLFPSHSRCRQRELSFDLHISEKNYRHLIKMTLLNLRQSKVNSARFPKNLRNSTRSWVFRRNSLASHELYPGFSEGVRLLWRVIIRDDQATTYNNFMHNTENVTQMEYDFSVFILRVVQFVGKRRTGNSRTLFALERSFKKFDLKVRNLQWIKSSKPSFD